MNSKQIVKNILKDYYNTFAFKFLIIYIIFGILVFSFSNTELSYINMIYYVMGHPYLIAFFLTPVSIFATFQILNSASENKNILIRFKNRKQLLQFQLNLILKNVIFIFATFLFITILFANLFSDRNHFILQDPYYPEINNVIGLIFLLIKLLIFVLSITIINMSIIKITKQKKILIINLLTLISFLGYIPEQISILFPAHYIGYSYHFTTFISNIIFSSIYLLSVLIIACIYYKYKCIQKEYK